MQTIKEYLLENNAEEIEDIATHGCSGGVSGFIYYNETIKFHDEHEDEIWEFMNEDFQSFGNKNVLEFIGSLGGAENVGSMEQLKNLLVWYAVERVAREIVDAGEVPEPEEEEEETA